MQRSARGGNQAATKKFRKKFDSSVHAPAAQLDPSAEQGSTGFKR